jgi:hypothetical protein
MKNIGLEDKHKFLHLQFKIVLEKLLNGDRILKPIDYMKENSITSI